MLNPLECSNYTAMSIKVKLIHWLLMDGQPLGSLFAVPNVIAHRSTPSGCSGVVVEYRTRNREVAGLTHTQSTASNLEQVANLLCAQVNSAFYPQRDGK